MVLDFEFRVLSSGFGVLVIGGLGFGVWGLGLDLRLRALVLGLGSRVEGSGFWV